MKKYEQIELIDNKGEKVVGICGMVSLGDNIIVATEDGIYKIPKKDMM